MTKTYEITAQGKTDLEAELEQLVSQRGALAQRLATARGYGDLSENAEYDSAKEAKTSLERRVSEIETILTNAVIIQKNKSDNVSIGSEVTLKGKAGDVQYQIVGPVEANPAERKISNVSPIGSALLGKAVGDEVEIKLPAGTKKYVVTSIN